MAKLRVYLFCPYCERSGMQVCYNISDAISYQEDFVNVHQVKFDCGITVASVRSQVWDE